jgi:hypothetical protein
MNPGRREFIPPWLMGHRAPTLARLKQGEPETRCPTLVQAPVTTSRRLPQAAMTAVHPKEVRTLTG